jgi:peptidoglycan/LPS O-acetylase OafA/YrhL
LLGSTRPTLAFAAVASAALCMAWLLPPLASVAALVVFASGVWLVRAGFDGPAGAALSHRWVVQLGKISYGVYLYHMVVPTLLDWLATGVPGLWRVLTPDTWSAFVLRSAATLTVAQLSFQYFEQPIRHSRFGARMATA